MSGNLKSALIVICITLMLAAFIACDPEPTPTATPLPTAAPTATSIPTPTPEPTATATPEPTPEPDAPLAFDPSVVRGTLSNGLSYYIRHNEEARDRPQIALVVKTPTPVAPIVVTGEGVNVETANLVAGIYIVAVSISGNQDCSFGTCISDNFIVRIESVNPSSNGIPATAFLVNEIVDDWSGSVTIRVGDALLDDLVPGSQLVSVDATGSKWEITLTRL